jgi:hypothetical protein
MGDLTIDSEGRIWRVAARRGYGVKNETRSIPCLARRAEHPTGAYLQIHVMINGRRINALAHRLVWYHFNGPIPPGLTINHKNGQKTDNRPSNLEIATQAEQVRHAVLVLRRQNPMWLPPEPRIMALLSPKTLRTADAPPELIAVVRTPAEHGQPDPACA